MLFLPFHMWFQQFKDAYVRKHEKKILTLRIRRNAHTHIYTHSHTHTHTHTHARTLATRINSRTSRNEETIHDYFCPDVFTEAMNDINDHFTCDTNY